MRRLLLFLLCLCLALPGGAALARGGGPIWIALSDGSEAYREVAELMREAFSGQKLSIQHWSAFQAQNQPPPEAVVTLGGEALIGLTASLPPRVPVVSLLAPRDALEKLLAGGGRPLTGMHFDQPYQRQMRMLRQAFPERRRIGVLLGPTSAQYQGEIQAAARRAGLEAVTEIALGQDELPPKLRALLAGSDVLLAVPDPLVNNSHTAQFMLLSSFRRNIPVAGYSASFVKAGAAIALYSGSLQVARQGVELLQAVLAGNLPSPRMPREFEISVNPGVARSLSLTLDAQAIAKKLREGEPP